MTITVVQSKLVTDAASGSFSSPTTAGNTVVVVIATGNTSNVSMSVSGITLGGAAGNFAQAEAAQSAFSSGTSFAAIWADPNCAGGQTAIAISGSNLDLAASSDNGWVAYEVSGLVSTATLSVMLDAHTHNSGTTGTAVSTGTTGATVQPGEIAFAVVVGFDALSSFTGAYTTTAVNDGQGTFGGGAYQVLSATGTQSFGAVMASSKVWAGAIATLKAASATVALTTPNIALAAPLLSPSAGATVALTTPNAALAAPLVTPAVARTVALTTPNLALAAPLLTPSAGAVVALTAPNLALTAPLVTPGGSRTVALTTPNISLAAPLVTLPAPVFPSPSAQLDVQLELNAGGTWVSATSDMDHGPAVIVRGHPDESTTVSPSTFSVTLTNSTARYSPDNVMSDLWPWCVQNMPVRASLPATANYLRLEPQPGDQPCAYVADTAALHLTGSIEARWAGRLTDWQGGVLGARVNGATPSWYWVLNGDGTMTFSWWDSGGTQWTASSDGALPFLPFPFAVKVTLGASAGIVTFYSASAIDGTYTQLGDAVDTAATSLRAGVAALETGTTLSSSYDLGQLCGAVSEFRLYSGIGGTVKADGQFSAQAAGVTSWTGTDGLSWVLNAPAEVSDRRYRGHFEASEWPQEEPEYNADKDNDTSVEVDALVPLVGGGLLRRLGQRAPVVMSPMKRGLLAQSGTLACVALWPCEPDSSSVSGMSSAVSGVGPMSFLGTGSPVLGGAAPFGSATAALPELNGPVWHGTVPAYTSHGSIVVRFAASTASIPGFTSVPLMRVDTTGTIVSLEVIAYGGGELGLIGYNSGGTQVFNSGGQTYNGGTAAQWWSVEAKIVSGSIEYALVGLVPGASAAQAWTTTGSGTVGNVTGVYVNHDAFTSWPTSMVLGMISVQSDWLNITDFVEYLTAYAGEAAGTRFARLCAENGIAFRSRGNLADTVVMGAQQATTLATLLQQCADADQGVWSEPRQVLGWQYTTRKALYNQPATAVVSYASDHLSMWTAPPTRDDQTAVNDVTYVNGSGASVRMTAEPGQPVDGGRMSALSPADGGIGTYAQTYNVYVNDDGDLTGLAGWKLHLGTADQARLPGILIDLASTDATGIYDAVLDLDLGGRLVISNPPRRLGPDPVTQLAQALTETLGYGTLTVGITGVPELPYEVVADGGGMHLAPADAALHTGVSTTATSWSVAASASDSTQLWSTNSADYPQNWKADGEEVTCTAMSGSSSPQTATVTRSVNGVVKSHLAGAAVTMWPPPVIGL